MESKKISEMSLFSCIFSRTDAEVTYSTHTKALFIDSFQRRYLWAMKQPIHPNVDVFLEATRRSNSDFGRRCSLKFRMFNLTTYFREEKRGIIKGAATRLAGCLAVCLYLSASHPVGRHARSIRHGEPLCHECCRGRRGGFCRLAVLRRVWRLFALAAVRGGGRLLGQPPVCRRATPEPHGDGLCGAGECDTGHRSCLTRLPDWAVVDHASAIIGLTQIGVIDPAR